MKNKYDVLIIGGGAAGFFTAINAANLNPNLNIAILERGKDVLTKVKISGGGRCNVTHAQFIPQELATNYPRGEQELLGPFHTFMTGDTITWFEERGVALKIEEDGRMFPTSDKSQTIIDCFLAETSRLNISVLKNEPVVSFQKINKTWEVIAKSGTYTCKTLVIATGSNPKIWRILNGIGHTIVEAVPSLFTFNIKDERIADLPGVASNVSIKIINTKQQTVLQSEGPLLITHWGMSGPAVLKLSAWGARHLATTNYHFSILVNWLLDVTEEEAVTMLMELKLKQPKQTLHKYAQFEIPKRLWQSLVRAAGLQDDEIWADISKKKLQNLANQLVNSHFEVTGKSTFKEEFVTAGGVNLKEVNFKTFESKLQPSLYFAGEVLNIDAITGGFNFQNAWTGGYIVAQNLVKD